MGFWFCLGYAGHTLGGVASSSLGSAHPVLATLVFVLGVLAQVLALILMINACGDLLRVRGDGSPADQLPSAVRTPPRAATVVATTLGPFLGVWALWGLVEDQVRQIYFINIALHGSGGGDDWSVDLRRIRFYLILALVCWLLRLAVGRIRSRWMAAPAIVLEGLWVFASFLALTAAGFRVAAWLRTRQVWQWAADAWRAMVDALPSLTLPFGWTLPRLLVSAGDWFWHSLLPGVGSAVLLPLVWLALTAAVFGWRQARTADLLADTPLEGHAARLRQGAVVTRLARWRPGGFLADVLSADLRGKYLPVLDALKLILRAGPVFLGSYLVLATVIETLRAFVVPLITLLVGPQRVPVALALEPFLTLAEGLLFTPLAVALYVAAVDRVFADLAGLSAGTPRSAARSTAAAGS